MASLSPAAPARPHDFYTISLKYPNANFRKYTFQGYESQKIRDVILMLMHDFLSNPEKLEYFSGFKDKDIRINPSNFRFTVDNYPGHGFDLNTEVHRELLTADFFREHTIRGCFSTQLHHDVQVLALKKMIGRTCGMD